MSSIGTLINNNGTFVIGKTLANTGQTFVIDNSFRWGLAGTINGGIVETSNNGNLFVTHFQTGTLSNVTLNGTVHVTGTLNASLSGGSGTIVVQAGAAEHDGLINIGTVLSGITVRGGSPVSISGFPPTQARVNVVNNQGRIRADRGIFNAGQPQVLRLIGSGLTNTGILEVSNEGNLLSLEDITFGSGGTLVVAGGGLFSITGNLNLSAPDDALLVQDQPSGQPYNNYLIATYSGIRTGTFDIVPPHIQVSYTTPGEIRLTSIPEPRAMLVLSGAGLGLGLVRSRPSGRLPFRGA
jgi:hypothetical protein